MEAAINWFEEQRDDLGHELLDCIFEGFNELEHNPFQNEKRYKEVSVKFIRRFPYGIHYLLEADDISVIALFHMKRNPKSWKSRLGPKG